jgi:hypothetical protein
MAITLGGSGGGASSPLPYTQFVVGQSKTFIVPITGRIKVVLTGGGGQGAFLPNSSGSPHANYGDATGGGGGGYSEKTFDVTAGETFVVTIGSGGSSALAPNDINTARVGNNAGNSSFVTASAAVSVNMVANGGGGGQFSAATSSVVSTAGGVGGTASGGDFNYTGGAGGSISRNVGNQYNVATTGGGAVALYGMPYHGGNITMTVGFGSATKLMATGGAGVGGHGGDVLVDDTGNIAYCSTGGSATKDGFTQETVTTTTLTTSVTAGGPTISSTISLIDAQGHGGSSRHSSSGSTYGSHGGFGGGGGSSMGLTTIQNSYGFAGNGGGFAGGGSLSYANGNTNISTGRISAGIGGVGGGGSGAFSGRFHTITGAINRFWSPGGDGMCIIMFV